MNESEMDDSLYLCVTAIRCISQHLLTMFSSLDILEMNQQRNSLLNNQRCFCYCDCVHRCAYLQNSDHLEFVSNIISESSSSIDDCLHCSKCGSFIHEISNFPDSTSCGDFINIDKHLNLATKYNTSIPFPLTLKNMSTTCDQDRYPASRFQKSLIERLDKEQQTSLNDTDNLQGDCYQFGISQDGELNIVDTQRSSFSKQKLLSGQKSNEAAISIEKIINLKKFTFDNTIQSSIESRLLDKGSQSRKVETYNNDSSKIEIAKSPEKKISSLHGLSNKGESYKYVTEFSEKKAIYDQEKDPYNLDSQTETMHDQIDQLTVTTEMYTPIAKYSVNENVGMDTNLPYTVGDTIYSPFHSEKNSEIENLKNEFVPTDLYVREFYLKNEINEIKTIDGGRSEAKHLSLVPDTVKTLKDNKYSNQLSESKIPSPSINENQIQSTTNSRKISHQISKMSPSKSISKKESTTQTPPLNIGPQPLITNKDVQDWSERNSKNFKEISANIEDTIVDDNNIKLISQMMKTLKLNRNSVTRNSSKNTANTKEVTTDQINSSPKQSFKSSDKVSANKGVIASSHEVVLNDNVDDILKNQSSKSRYETLSRDERTVHPDLFPSISKQKSSKIKRSSETIKTSQPMINQDSHHISSVTHITDKPPSATNRHESATVKSHSSKAKSDKFDSNAKVINSTDVFVITDGQAMVSSTSFEKNIKILDNINVLDEVKNLINLKDNNFPNNLMNDRIPDQVISDIKTPILYEETSTNRLSPIRELQTFYSSPESYDGNQLDNKKVQSSINETNEPEKLSKNSQDKNSKEIKNSKESLNSKNATKRLNLNYKNDIVDVHMSVPFIENVRVQTNESIVSGKKIENINTDIRESFKSSRGNESIKVEKPRERSRTSETKLPSQNSRDKIPGNSNLTETKTNYNSQAKNENENPYSVILETNLLYDNNFNPVLISNSELRTETSNKLRNSQKSNEKETSKKGSNETNNKSDNSNEMNLESNKISAFTEAEIHFDDVQIIPTNDELLSNSISGPANIEEHLQSSGISSRHSIESSKLVKILSHKRKFSKGGFESVVKYHSYKDNRCVFNEDMLSAYHKNSGKPSDHGTHNSSNIDNASLPTSTWTTSGHIIKSTNVLIRSDSSSSTSFYLPLRNKTKDKKSNLPFHSQIHHLFNNNKLPNSFCTVDLLLSASINDSENHSQLTIFDDKENENHFKTTQTNQMTFESDLFSCVIDESVSEKSKLYSKSSTIFAIPNTSFSKEGNNINSTRNISSNEFSHDSSLYINVILYNSPVIQQVIPKIPSKNFNILSPIKSSNKKSIKKENLVKKNFKTMSDFYQPIKSNCKYLNKSNMVKNLNEISDRKCVDISILLTDNNDSIRSHESVSKQSNSSQSIILEALLETKSKKPIKCRTIVHKNDEHSKKTIKSSISCFT